MNQKRNSSLEVLNTFNWQSVVLVFTLFAMFILASPVKSQAAENLKQMFDEGTISGEIRYRNFARNFDGAADRHDNAIGGSLGYTTAGLHGVSFGVSFLTSNDLEADNGDDGTYGLLMANHESHTNLGEYYVKGSWFKTDIVFGAHAIKTPFMHKWDFRMTPKLYKGLSVVNKSVTGLEVQAHYITEVLQHNADEYANIAQSYNRSIDKDKATTILGLKYTLPKDVIDTVTLQGWTYETADVYRTNYIRTDYSKKLTDTYTLNLRGDYVTQEDTGSSLAGKKDTDQYGLKAGLAAYGMKLDFAYSKQGDDSLAIPFGDSLMIAQAPGTAYRAEETAYLARLTFDLSRYGLNGLWGYVDHAYYNTPDSGVNASADYRETDFDLFYNFSGSFDGLGVRFRYAHADYKEEQGGVDCDDIRFYVTYKFKFGGAKKSEAKKS